jgi:hypothetical protein
VDAVCAVAAGEIARRSARSWAEPGWRNGPDTARRRNLFGSPPERQFGTPGPSSGSECLPPMRFLPRLPNRGYGQSAWPLLPRTPSGWGLAHRRNRYHIIFWARDTNRTDIADGANRKCVPFEPIEVTPFGAETTAARTPRFQPELLLRSQQSPRLHARPTMCPRAQQFVQFGRAEQSHRNKPLRTDAYRSKDALPLRAPRHPALLRSG